MNFFGTSNSIQLEIELNLVRCLIYYDSPEQAYPNGLDVLCNSAPSWPDSSPQLDVARALINLRLQSQLGNYVSFELNKHARQTCPEGLDVVCNNAGIMAMHQLFSLTEFS